MFNIHTVTREVGGRTMTIETGKLARQASGSALVKYGDTHVLVTVCCSKDARPGQSFFPLTIEYAEKYYASGKIPGSFFKREGRPTGEAILSCRLLDRPIRPLFPEGFLNEVQVVATILSLDPTCDPDVAAAAGTSAALHISDIPFAGPTATIKVGRINGEYIINPTWEQSNSDENDIDCTIAGTKNAIMMVEGGAREIPESEVLTGILKAHEEIKEICAIIDDLRTKCGREKREFIPVEINPEIKSEVTKLVSKDIEAALQTKEKLDRYTAIGEAKKKMMETLVPASLMDSDPKTAAERETHAKMAFEDLHYNLMRTMILDKSIRIDGRDLTTVRPIETEVGLVPNAHGSALFTRGETQVLGTVTLGTKDDEQIVDSLYENTTRNFMLHYNFPPYSVGECGRMGGQSRREIGHGALAERAIKILRPKHEEFPYTIRIVCETLESNGSSSMGSVCASSMALMHAGVPYKNPIAGIAMGLIKEGNKFAILSDILGDEDHLGDMDFKVAGTKNGVTSIQMDIKIEGVNEEIMKTALAQANEGRLHILSKMAESITQPNTELARNAPRITSIRVPTDKIAVVIGPGGKMIKEIIAQSGAKIDIQDDGTVNVASNDPAASEKAIEMIKGITQEVEVGKTYKGIVKKIVDFGAFVGVLPNQDGLLHVSEIAHERVNNVDDYLKEGEEIEVKVIDVDQSGKVRLSRKELLPRPEGMPAQEPREDRRPPRRDDRGDRGGRGGGGRGGRGGGGSDRNSGPRNRD